MDVKPELYWQKSIGYTWNYHGDLAIPQMADVMSNTRTYIEVTNKGKVPTFCMKVGSSSTKQEFAFLHFIYQPLLY